MRRELHGITWVYMHNTISGKNHFELFEIPIGYGVDLSQVSERYHALQRATHPDRFVTAPDQERRIAVEGAAQVNEAFQTLRSPLARARYILELHGITLDDRDTAMPPTFLMQQMELREALEAVVGATDPFQALDLIRNELDGLLRELQTGLAIHLAGGDVDHHQLAKEMVRKMQFFMKLQTEVELLEERLTEAL